MNKEALIEVIKGTSFAVGLPISAEGAFSSSSQSIKFRIQGLSELETFYFLGHRSPMAWILELKFDEFSQHLIDWLAAKDSDAWQKISDELDQIPKESLSVESNIENFLTSDRGNIDNTSKFEFVIWTHPPLDWNQVPLEREIELLSEVLSNAFILVDSLSKGSSESIVDEFVPDLEGMKKIITCGKYTRSRKNRKKCLDTFGYVCVACGLNPELQYGPEGKFIIHVHHITPVSKMDEPKVLTPALDLVPLCPNCHNFVHKFNPPKSILEIKNLMASKSH